ncbi:MAG: hypothetical protein E3J35_06560 [Methanomassiliicoccales archaeon]|nr:MAG: hypothetical protein E3J35_06560 [Methanomassiliicoccales archaeon]
MEFHDIIEKKRFLALLLLGLGALMLLLDFINPFTEFLKTWNIVYILVNFFAFLAILAPAYIILGYLVERDDTAKLFFSCLWIPIIHYLLKGFLLLYYISQDPNLLNAMGLEIGWPLLDWRDFAVFYYGSFPLFVITVWAFTIVFMTFGVLINFLFGENIRGFFERIRKKSSK